jgi:hypothetical protein
VIREPKLFGPSLSLPVAVMLRVLISYVLPCRHDALCSLWVAMTMQVVVEVAQSRIKNRNRDE